jgi:hypothetical protein
MVGGGGRDALKIFTGLTPPNNSREYDIWVETTKKIDKVIFDRDFNLNKIYPNNS